MPIEQGYKSLQMDTQRTAFVFFSTVRGRQQRRYRQAISWFIRFVSNFPYAHCCIGDGSVVLDVTFKHDRFWSQGDFESKYPSLACVLTVRTPRAVRLDRYRLRPANRVLPSVWRWLTFGAATSDDCVCTIGLLLREAGLPLPRYIVTPHQLFRWLILTGDARYERPND